MERWRVLGVVTEGTGARGAGRQPSGGSVDGRWRSRGGAVGDLAAAGNSRGWRRGGAATEALAVGPRGGQPAGWASSGWRRVWARRPGRCCWPSRRPGRGRRGGERSPVGRRPDAGAVVVLAGDEQLVRAARQRPRRAAGDSRGRASARSAWHEQSGRATGAPGPGRPRSALAQREAGRAGFRTLRASAGGAATIARRALRGRRSGPGTCVALTACGGQDGGRRRFRRARRAGRRARGGDPRGQCACASSRRRDCSPRMLRGRARR